MSTKIQEDLARIGRSLDSITAHVQTKVETTAANVISKLADHVENLEKQVKKEKDDAKK